MIEVGLGSLTLRYTAEYAEKKKPSQRELQSGAAYEEFLKVFGCAADAELLQIMSSICEFSQFDDPQAELVLESGSILTLEEEDDGRVHLDFESLEEAIKHVKWSIRRLCDWIASNQHFRTHAMAHLSRASLASISDQNTGFLCGIQAYSPNT